MTRDAGESGFEATAGLSAVRSAYVQRLRSQAADLREALVRAQQGDTDALAELRRIAHRLHGTAGSFGFDEVSYAAAQLEELVETQPTAAQMEAAGSSLLRLMETAE